MRKWLSCFLALALLFTLCVPAFAAGSKAQEAAQTLYELGLFKGTGADASGNPEFDLDRAPTRHEAVTMLVRLLGKEAEALAGGWEIPFTDVADWAKPYVGYAYANGLTTGVSETSFGGERPVTAAQYLTFILRALGYDSRVDFQWDRAWELSDAIGLTAGAYGAKINTFLRGDAALISERALSARLKGSNVMLLRKLYNQKSAADYAAAAKTIQVSKLGLPAAIGKTTLTYNDAFALVGQAPAVIAEAVKTVGDVAQYMVAANFGAKPRATYTPWFGENEWGFDAPGEEQLRQNYACCCGGYTNMALYLLKDDYEEQGVIRWLGQRGDGNHTINYVKTGGKYYVFDLTDFRGKLNRNNGGNARATITVLDRLEDYYDQIPSDYPKVKITSLVALTDTGVDYPWGYIGETEALIFPTETKGHILQIYHRNASGGVSFRDVDIEIPFWNSDRLELLEQAATAAEHDVYEILKKEYIDPSFEGSVQMAEALQYDAFVPQSNELVLCWNGGDVPPDWGFGTVRDGDTAAVYWNKQRLTDFAFTVQDPANCTVTKGADGVLTFTNVKADTVLTITGPAGSSEFVIITK